VNYRKQLEPLSGPRRSGKRLYKAAGLQPGCDSTTSKTPPHFRDEAAVDYMSQKHHLTDRSHPVLTMHTSGDGLVRTETKAPTGRSGKMRGMNASCVRPSSTARDTALYPGDPDRYSAVASTVWIPESGAA